MNDAVSRPRFQRRVSIYRRPQHYRTLQEVPPSLTPALHWPPKLNKKLDAESGRCGDWAGHLNDGGLEPTYAILASLSHHHHRRKIGQGYIPRDRDAFPVWLRWQDGSWLPLSVAPATMKHFLAPMLHSPDGAVTFSGSRPDKSIPNHRAYCWHLRRIGIRVSCGRDPHSDEGYRYTLHSEVSLDRPPQDATIGSVEAIANPLLQKHLRFRRREIKKSAARTQERLIARTLYCKRLLEEEQAKQAEGVQGGSPAAD